MFVKFISGMMALVSVVALSSCKKSVDYAGVWKLKNPVDITVKIPAAISATYYTTMDIKNGHNKSEGTISLSDMVDIAEQDSVGGIVKVTASASVQGQWQVDAEDNDDIFISYDMSTIKTISPAIRPKRQFGSRLLKDCYVKIYQDTV